MSATNATSTINLPLFIGTDKPAWLTDWNGAMNIIDSAIAALQTAEGGTATALATLSQSVSALADTVSQHTTAIQTVTTATAGNTGSINTINSLIGNGTPTTTDKTLIGAINEINAKIPESGDVAAEDVTYDNQTSGLTATDVQAAIDELAGITPTFSIELDYANIVTHITAATYTPAKSGVLIARSLAGLASSSTSGFIGIYKDSAAQANAVALTAVDTNGYGAAQAIVNAGVTYAIGANHLTSSEMEFIPFK